MKLSIITVNLNNCKGLKKTLGSVAAQTWHDFEHIIIDGASNDGSVDVIREYEKSIANSQDPTAKVHWKSEPDTGIYNAMNKGIRIAQGDYFLFLNSGDWLYDNNVLSKVFSRNNNPDVLFGDIMMHEDDSIPKMRKFEDAISFEYIACEGLCHNSTFIRSELLKPSGYSEDFRICSDRLHFVQLALENRAFSHLPFIVTNVDMTGISSVNRNALQIEIDKIVDMYVPKTISQDFVIIHGDHQNRLLMTPSVKKYLYLRQKSYFFRKFSGALVRMVSIFVR